MAMSLTEPSWRVKTRPCPFYQKGRCHFSERCNFLHIDASWSANETTLVDSGKDSPASKGSISSIKSFRSVRSPPRSPKTASLLAALSDIIGCEEDEEEESDNDEEAVEVASPTEIAKYHPDDIDAPTDPIYDVPPCDHVPSTSESAPDEDATIRSRISNHMSSFTNTADHYENNLLSPFELSDLKLMSLKAHDGELPTRDDGNWAAPMPFVMSPPRSPALSSTFDLISSPFGSQTFRFMSPGISAFRVPPSPFSSSSFFGESDEELIPLDLSLDSPSDFQAGADEDPIDATVRPEAQPLRPEQANEDEFVEDVTSHWDSADNPTAMFLGEPPPEGDVKDDLALVETSDMEQINGEEFVEDVIVPSSHWDSTDNPTAVFLGMPPSGSHAKRSLALAQASAMERINGEEFVKDAIVPSPQWNSKDNSTSVFLGIPPSESDVKDDLVEASDMEQINGEEFVEDAIVPSSHWDSTDNPTAVFLGMPPSGTHFKRSLALVEASAMERINGEEFVKDAILPTSQCDSTDNPAAVFLGMPPSGSDVKCALAIVEASPIHYLRSPSPEFDEEEMQGHSSFNTSVDVSDVSVRMAVGESFLTDSPTARLAYLSSPAPDDTLQSLYAAYSDGSPNKSMEAVASPDPLPPPTISPPARERVFTPPPALTLTRGRSDAPKSSLTSNSISTLPSPVSAPFEVRGRPPLSEKAIGKQPERVFTRDPSASTERSTKVPFGFRKSVVLKRARDSLMVNDHIAQNVPPSPVSAYPYSDSPTSENEDHSQSHIPSHPKGLKPLRLSTILNFPLSNNSPSTHSHPASPVHHSSLSSISISSSNISLSNNTLLSSVHSHSSSIPEHSKAGHLLSRISIPAALPLPHDILTPPYTAPIQQWHKSTSSPRNSTFQQHDITSARSSYQRRCSTRLSEPSHDFHNGNSNLTDDETNDRYDHTIRRPITASPRTAPISSHFPSSPRHSIATPSPDLLFAIASDDVDQVQQVLESGSAGPNDSVGPQSALAFALTNSQLSNKLDIVKTLLAYGADPNKLKSELQTMSNDEKKEEGSPPTENLDAATRYYVNRADASVTRGASALMQRSFFRHLSRMRYGIIGQDRTLEQLFRTLSIHSQQINAAPIVIMLCGPSGLGKSLLAQKFGSALDVPTHTVNMTTLRSSGDLWQSYSMGPIGNSTRCTLLEFLANNEGKRCVVVLDEIEKTSDPKALWSLLVPWELGQCSFEANSHNIDVRNVIWIGTSNIGQDLILQHYESRSNPDELMPREEYQNLMRDLRPRVSDRLGASILSRVTTLLPFVPFTREEKRAIASEALHTLSGDLMKGLTAESLDEIVEGALEGFVPAEGARSLYRAVSNQLVDAVDLE